MDLWVIVSLVWVYGAAVVALGLSISGDWRPAQLAVISALWPVFIPALLLHRILES